jgi:hypothetical protein
MGFLLTMFQIGVYMFVNKSIFHLANFFNIMGPILGFFNVQNGPEVCHAWCSFVVACLLIFVVECIPKDQNADRIFAVNCIQKWALHCIGLTIPFFWYNQPYSLETASVLTLVVIILAVLENIEYYKKKMLVKKGALKKTDATTDSTADTTAALATTAVDAALVKAVDATAVPVKAAAAHVTTAATAAVFTFGGGGFPVVSSFQHLAEAEKFLLHNKQARDEFMQRLAAAKP